MTQRSRPFTGTSVGDAGPYSAQNWQETWARMIGYSADNANYAPLRGIENELAVNATSPATAQVQVETGAALAQGIFYYSDAVETFPIQANGSGNSRIDLIILSLDYIGQEVRLSLLIGTPSGSPAIPSVTQTAGVLWEIPLARVLVASGFSSIAQSDITDMRQFSNIPMEAGVHVVNNAGTILEKGAVVIRDTGAASTALALDITTTTTFANPLAIGVIESRTAAAGGTGRVIQYGIVPVICDGSVSIGDYLVTSTTAGQATSLPTGNQRVPFGVVVLGNGGAGTACLAFVDFRPFRNEPKIAFSVSASGGQTVVANILTLLTFDVANFNYGGDFDLSTERFTPQVAGKYSVGGQIQATGAFLAIYKNGAEIQQGTGASFISLANVIEMNGTTDYLELFGFSTSTTITSKAFWGVWVSE